jgi:hypothetical protein
MKYLRYPLLGLVTFIIGVVVSPIHFYLEGIGCGRVIDGGGGFSVSSYKSSYFVKLSFAHAGYVSTEKANEVFNQRLGEAANVIEVAPKLNKAGFRVGRRAVVIFFEPTPNQYYACVFWTDDRIIHSIYSTSILHVIEFEKHNLEAYAD